MKFLIIDNYDSFVYNIAQYLGELGVECDVFRNDKITISQIQNSNYDGIIISPGPGTPEDKKYFGICSDVIKDIGPTTPILGVCLGHQGIIDAFGGKVIVMTETDTVLNIIKSEQLNHRVLLMMSSGNFDGIDYDSLGQEILSKLD